MGTLIPGTEYKLLPMVSFNLANIEIRLNPFAYFTSGGKSSIIRAGLQTN